MALLSDSVPPRLQDDKSQREQIITSILRKRRPLLDVDISWIETDIAAYEQELSNLETQITLLKRRKERMEHSLSRRKSLLSPVLRLPGDILVEIFRWAAHRPKNSLDVTKGVWPLGQVCGWWREIVLSSPILWSVVILEAPYTRYSVDILTHHFCHSAEFPLWIALTTEDNANDGRVLDMVIQKSALWKMVDIYAPLKDLEKLSSVSGNIPLLEELYVHAKGKAYFSTDALSSAPSLRCAELEPLEFSKLPLNACFLTHFSGTLRHLADIRYIAQIQTLTDVHILFYDDADRHPDSGNILPVKMEQLQYLSVNDVRILDALTAPSLRDFGCHLQRIANERDDVHLLQDFLARSACSVEHLYFSPESVQKIHHLTAFTKNVSSLVVLYHNDGTLPPLDPLTLPETLPAMKKLRLCVRTDACWTRRYVEGVIDVVRQRFDEERAAVLNVTRLSHLQIDRVDGSEVVDQLEIEGLDALGEKGLDWDNGYIEIDEYWTGSWFTSYICI